MFKNLKLQEIKKAIMASELLTLLSTMTLEKWNLERPIRFSLLVIVAALVSFVVPAHAGMGGPHAALWAAINHGVQRQNTPRANARATYVDVRSALSIPNYQLPSRFIPEGDRSACAGSEYLKKGAEAGRQAILFATDEANYRTDGHNESLHEKIQQRFDVLHAWGETRPPEGPSDWLKGSISRLWESLSRRSPEQVKSDNQNRICFRRGFFGAMAHATEIVSKHSKPEVAQACLEAGKRAVADAIAACQASACQAKYGSNCRLVSGVEVCSTESNPSEIRTADDQKKLKVLEEMSEGMPLFYLSGSSIGPIASMALSAKNADDLLGKTHKRFDGHWSCDEHAEDLDHTLAAEDPVDQACYAALYVQAEDSCAQTVNIAQRGEVQQPPRVAHNHVMATDHVEPRAPAAYGSGGHDGGSGGAASVGR